MQKYITFFDAENHKISILPKVEKGLLYCEFILENAEKESKDDSLLGKLRLNEFQLCVLINGLQDMLQFYEEAPEQLEEKESTNE